MQLLRLLAVFCTAIAMSATVVHAISADCKPAACGHTPIEPRLNTSKEIETAKPYSWPWLATLCGRTKHNVCTYYNFTLDSESNTSCSMYLTGTAIGQRWVLTVVKNVDYLDSKPNLYVRTGVYNWFSRPS